MEIAKKVMANASLAIIILLSFLLFFEQRLELPAWLQAFGRMHPLLLHLPIGLLLLTALLVVLRRHFESNSFHLLISFLLHLSVLTASLTALMGLFLSREGGYNDQELQLHKWFGVATCYAGGVLLLLNQRRVAFKISILVCFAVLIVTGHYGAMLTHGENFVLGPLQKNDPGTGLTENASAFEAVVLPLFDRKCASCHNDTKAKGKLILTSFDQIMKGGKSGELWNVNDIHNSLLMTRLLLPLEEKKHMPPQDKPQLTVDELGFISLWLNTGADTQRKLGDYPEDDSLRILALKLIANNQQHTEAEKRYHFDFMSPEKLSALNNPYRSVFQIAQNEPAIQADFFVREAFDKKDLEELRSVKEQLISLNLSKMPVTDEDVKLILVFKNLEALNLNNTEITGKTLSDLKELEKLQSLSLAGTNVTAESINNLSAVKSLKKVFIWNTNIKASEAEALRAKHPNILWESGYVPDAREVLQLSTPLLLSEQILKAGEKIVLKASLPGTTIRYTTNGTDPDSVTGVVYSQPIVAKAYQVLKAVAFKEGWKHSSVADFIIFQTGYKPSRSELKTDPEPQYIGEGVSTFSDGKKGSPEFFRDPVWIAFRNGPLEAVFYFDDAPEIQSVTLSYAESTYAMTMPPVEMEVWGGDNDNNLILLQTIKPALPSTFAISRVKGVEAIFPVAKRKCYKIIAKPLSKQPAFRETKEKGWLMVDEIFFN